MWPSQKTWTLRWSPLSLVSLAKTSKWPFLRIGSLKDFRSKISLLEDPCTRGPLEINWIYSRKLFSIYFWKLIFLLYLGRRIPFCQQYWFRTFHWIGWNWSSLRNWHCCIWTKCNFLYFNIGLAFCTSLYVIRWEGLN